LNSANGYAEILVPMKKSSLPLNAMIVEDEDDLSFLLSLVLIQKNLNPLRVSSIAEAKTIIEKLNPLVLFLDNRLPDGYGIDYISEVKQEHPDTKIVIITAHNSLQEVQSAFKNGADYFISKPFSSDTIRNTIDLLISENIA
jgi:two-component system, OmpR family, response regulator